ncbi:MAG TPA: hypothetical protein VLH35_05890 [Candidatus Acidoferrales bacterium]|nr:hypothetical protein [Candidatus Acidoferrales bacterium]
MSRRVVVEVRADLHRELRKLSANYDVHLYVVVNSLLEDCLLDQAYVALVLGKLDLE